MTETTRRRHPVRALALLLLAALAVYFVTGYVRSLFLESSHVALTLQSRSGQTGAVRIAQVSDLHRAVYGEDNSELVALIASKYPNLIVATGDMIDVRTEGIDECVDLFARLRKIAPVVYSLGNHEVERPDLRALVEALEDVGVLVVDGNVVTVEAAFRCASAACTGRNTCRSWKTTGPWISCCAISRTSCASSPRTASR